jgi:hypothetical protein
MRIKVFLIKFLIKRKTSIFGGHKTPEALAFICLEENQFY